MSTTRTTTKLCNQCQKELEKDQFASKQWKKRGSSTDRCCRLCGAYTKLSQDTSRVCYKCKVDKPRMEFAISQWSRGKEALCHPCREAEESRMLNSLGDLGTAPPSKELPDKTLVCRNHNLECCDICMMDFSLPNQYQRKRNELGREELSQEELDSVTEEWERSNNIMKKSVSKKVCIMDGQPVCPRESRKLRCPCNEVTYCSKACQRFHWKIHKMTCKYHAKTLQEKAEAKRKKQEEEEEAKRKAAVDSLTEEQKNVARMEAFMSEQNGRRDSIAECAWQLVEHPLVIGGGSITIGIGGETTFTKGDVAKIYRERMGVEWDGSPRFGLRPYVPNSNNEAVDWIAIARRGHKSQRFQDMEEELRRRI